MSNQITIIDKSAAWLASHAMNVTSQFGEDGLVMALFDRVGVKNKWCFEVGAHDGVFLSNTKWMRDAGWQCVLIEGDKTIYRDKLRHLDNDKCLTLGVYVADSGIHSLDGLLDFASLKLGSVPSDLDFGCIDIDGNDWLVWFRMIDYKPRVMLIEFNPYGSPDATIETSKEGQAGLNPIVALGRSKGYVPLLHTYCNVLFVREDAWQ